MSDLPRVLKYESEAFFQAYMRAKRAGQSSTPFRFTDGKTRWLNVTWNGESFTRDSFDFEPLAPQQK